VVDWNVALEKYRFFYFMNLLSVFCIIDFRIVGLALEINGRLGYIRRTAIYLTLNRIFRKCRLSERVVLFMEGRIVVLVKLPVLIISHILWRSRYVSILAFYLNITLTGYIVWIAYLLELFPQLILKELLK
jgi:hypothetical protein